MGTNISDDKLDASGISETSSSNVPWYHYQQEPQSNFQRDSINDTDLPNLTAKDSIEDEEENTPTNNQLPQSPVVLFSDTAENIISPSNSSTTTSFDNGEETILPSIPKVEVEIIKQEESTPILPEKDDNENDNEMEIYTKPSEDDDKNESDILKQAKETISEAQAELARAKLEKDVLSKLEPINIPPMKVPVAFEVSTSSPSNESEIEQFSSPQSKKKRNSGGGVALTFDFQSSEKTDEDKARARSEAFARRSQERARAHRERALELEKRAKERRIRTLPTSVSTKHQVLDVKLQPPKSPVGKEREKLLSRLATGAKAPLTSSEIKERNRRLYEQLPEVRERRKRENEQRLARERRERVKEMERRRKEKRKSLIEKKSAK